MSGADRGALGGDGTRPIRAGEELDLERLAPWLRAHIPGVGPDDEIVVDQFPSGHSNLTYRVKAGAREVVLRRPPFGTKVKSAHDMGREFRVLSALHAVYPPAPRPLAHSSDESILGAPFYVMERLQGVILRKDTRDPGWTPETVRALSTALIDNLADIHAIDYAAAGLAELGKPEGYVERQVSGWSKRYADAKTDEIPEVEAAAAWLAANLPASPAPSLIHNDYKYDNVVLAADDPTKIIGVLDWEMATIGDPLMDLGTTLAYWIMDDDAPDLRMLRWGPTNLAGSLNRKQLAARYAERTGRDVSGIAYHYAFALFKNAVVIQQIYARWKHGLTKDARFAGFIEGVKILARASARAIEQGSI